MARTVVLVLALVHVAAAPRAGVPGVFFVCVDGSGSVPPSQFAAYREMVRVAVLELLRPLDVVVLLRADRPGDDPETFVLEGRISRLEAGVRQIYDRLGQLRPSRGRHPTDLGRVLDHAKRRIELDRGLVRGDPPRYLVVVVSDGVPDGRQTVDAAPVAGDADWRILFLGVNQDREVPLRELARESGFGQPDRVKVVPFSHWQQLSPLLPRFFDRPANPALAKSLAAGTSGR